MGTTTAWNSWVEDIQRDQESIATKKNRVFEVKPTKKVKLTVTAPLKISEWEGTGEEWDEWATTTSEINSKATDTLWDSREK